MYEASITAWGRTLAILPEGQGILVLHQQGAQEDIATGEGVAVWIAREDMPRVWGEMMEVATRRGECPMCDALLAGTPSYVARDAGRTLPAR